MRTPVSIGVMAGLPNAGALLDVLAHSPHADVRWVCSERRRGQAAPGARRGVLQTSRFDDLLCDERVDAVMIVAPVAARYELAAAALEADKHVYVAGVLAQQAREAEELLRAAKGRGRSLVAGDLHWFDPAVAKLADLVRSAELGDVLYLRCERHASEDDLLWGAAAEEVAVILAVLGDEPTSVTALGESYVDLSALDLLDVRLAFATGIVAQVNLSTLDAPAGSRHAVVGSRATAVVERSASLRSPTLTVYPKEVSGKATSSPAAVCPRLADDDPLSGSCDAFLMSARSLTAAGQSRNTVAVLEVLEHIERSLRGGRPIDVAQSSPARELRVVSPR